MIRELTSASNLYRRKVCPGSAAAEEGLPEDQSDISDEGTLLHAHHADPARDRSVLTGPQVQLIETAEQLTAQVLSATLTAHGLPADEPREKGWERELWLFKGLKRIVSGHCDMWFYFPRPRLLVLIDDKFGFLEVETAEANLQLRHYACAGSQEWDCETVVVAIIQPRLFGDRRLTMAQYDRATIEAAKLELYDIVAASKAENAPRHADQDACRYCKAKMQCDAYRATLLNVQTVASPQSIELVDDATLDRVFEAIKFASMIQKAAKAEMLKRLEAGGMPRWKLRPSGAITSIKDEVEAKRILLEYMSAEQYEQCCEANLGLIVAKLKEIQQLPEKEAKALAVKILGPALEKKEKEPSIVLV